MTQTATKGLRIPHLGIGAWVGAAIFGFFVLFALFGPFLVSRAPTTPDLEHILAPPSFSHLLGTDDNGCDLLSEMCYGARIELGLTAAVVTLCLMFGVLLGTLAGYRGGWFDEVVMRIIDVLLAFPGILLNIAVAALVPRAGIGVLIFALAVNGWVGYARVARGQALRVREMEYVQAARALGVGSWRLVWRHLLPNILSPIVVQATFGAAGVVLVETSLSFLGLGPPIPYTWGALLSRGTDNVYARYLIFVPGMAIALLVLGCNLLGDGLRDYLDPRGGRRA